MFPSILIVDDEPSILQSLKGILSDEGFEVLTASNGYEALKTIENESPDLVLLDVWMPGIDGMETLKEIKKDNQHIQVIIITGHGTIDTAVKATKLGAYDFIEKPLSIDKVIVTINNALNFRRLEEENRYLRKKTIEKHSLTGNCGAIMHLQKEIHTAAPTDAWILITGENGTGKELVARTIHQFSRRSDKPMIDVNCSKIQEDLMDSELFGHEKGAFSGATAKKIGKFELANQGTLFLDEIGDMSIKNQGKLLRILEDKKFQRVGGGRDIHVDVRIIASTNKKLEMEIQKGHFREDLFFRLNVMPIDVPPLRERLEDIPILVGTFLKELAKDNQSAPKRVTQEVIELFNVYSWPGNVREMKNLLGRLAITVNKEMIEASDIPAPYNPYLFIDTDSSESLFAFSTFSDARKAFEKTFILKKLNQYGQSVQRTAKAIGESVTYVQKILQNIE
ncbi:MAG: sigma-54-dependent Fis family transcriptional regulator [Candidatus Magnetomorum sp.]|nr:sigma-54-dependent Fis family transcriptional regulator [Candidatus Magnetomorum sp.]